MVVRDDDLRRALTDANPWWRAASHGTDPVAWVGAHRLLLDRADHDLGYRAEVLDDIATLPYINDRLVVLTGPRRVGKSVALLDVAAALCARRDVDPRQVIHLPCDGFATRDLRRALTLGRELTRVVDQTSSTTRVWLLDEVSSINGWTAVLKATRDGTAFGGDTVVATGSRWSPTDDVEGNLLAGRAGRAAVHRLGEHLTSMGHDVELAFPAALATLFKPYWDAWSVVGPTVRREQVDWLSRRLGRPCRAGDLSDDVLDLAEQAERIDPAAVATAYDTIRSLMAPIPTWWDSGFDLLVTPVTLQPAWKLGKDAPIRTGMFCAPFSFTGQPALVVPILWNEHDVPVGAQIVGRHGSDEALLALGASLQTAVGWLERRPPIFAFPPDNHEA